MKRRDFVKALPLGVAAVGVPFSIGGFAGRAFGKGSALDAILNGADASDRVLVVINLAGGNDGLNTVIPFQDAAYQKARPTIGFGSADTSTLQSNLLSSQTIARPDLALNPAMSMPPATGIPSFYDMFKAGKIAVVNNVGYASPNLSHFRSTDIWNTASDSNVVLSSGWLGRWLENIDPGYPGNVVSGDDPLAITFGGSMSAVFQGDTTGMGIALNDPTNYAAAGTDTSDAPPATHAGDELTFVRSIYAQSDAYNATFGKFSEKKSPTTIGYPSTRIAAQLKNIAWCIQSGMKTKVYFVSISGFDTHFNQNAKDPSVQGQGQLLMQVGQAIAAFQADLEAFGIADRVIGMTYSEFGRRVNENGSNGTDHGTCAPQFVFGSQVNGEVYSTNPDLVNLDSNADLVWKIDFRQYYAGILGDWFGASDALRNSVLMNKSFGTQFAVNSSSTTQSLIRTPASQGVRTPEQPGANFELQTNYPNPFHDRTTIAFSLASTMPVTLEIYDERGSKVSTLVSEVMPRGTYSIPFSASGLSNGTYIARLEGGGAVQVRQMTFEK